MYKESRKGRWPYVVIVGLALIEPLTHLWLKYGLSGEVVHSGFRIGDSPFFLTAMSIFSNDFFSPYVTCQSTDGAHNPWLFALPHHGIYAALGWIAKVIHLDPFLLLGAAESVVGLSQSFEATQDRRGLYKLASRASKVA